MTGGDPGDAEDRFRRVVEHLPAIVYLESADAEPGAPGPTLYVSPQVESILGFTPQEWLADPRTWARQCHPADRPRVRAAYERVQREGGDLRVEYRMYTKTGEVRSFRDEAVLVRDESGAPSYWQGIMFDVTAARRSEAGLAEARAREQAILEQIPVVVTIDPVEEGPGRYVSPQVGSMFGYSPDEWYADPSLRQRIVHPEDRASPVAEPPTDAATASTYRVLAKDGRTVWVQDLTRLVRDEEGRAAYRLGVLIDVTEQHRNTALRAALDTERTEAERLRVEDEIKTTFLQAVSHDLRTPLAAILGLSMTLERDDLGLAGGEGRDLARRITVNARKLDAIVSDFLDLERLRRGLATPRVERVDLGALIRESVANSELVGERRLALDVAPLVIEADPSMIERIVDNLLTNTVKHTPGDSRIWVRLEARDDGALLSVEDDGPGVAAPERERIFEPYRQGAGVSSGSGVGLALVRRFAELHGGTAWAEERRGGGSTFKVSLARRPPGAEAVAAPDQPTASGSSAESQA